MVYTLSVQKKVPSNKFPDASTLRIRKLQLVKEMMVIGGVTPIPDYDFTGHQSRTHPTVASVSQTKQLKREKLSFSLRRSEYSLHDMFSLTQEILTFVTSKYVFLPSDIQTLLSLKGMKCIALKFRAGLTDSDRSNYPDLCKIVCPTPPKTPSKKTPSKKPPSKKKKTNQVRRRYRLRSRK